MTQHCSYLLFSSTPSPRFPFPTSFPSLILYSSLFYYHSVEPLATSDVQGAAITGDKKIKTKVTEFDATMVHRFSVHYFVSCFSVRFFSFVSSNLFSNCQLYPYSMLFCSISVYSILFYSIPSYPILSYPILSYPILSYPIKSYPIQSYPILSYPILSYSIPYYPILSYPILSNPILPHASQGVVSNFLMLLIKP